MTRQCVAGRRIGSSQELREETTAWHEDVNPAQRGVEWQMNIDDARTKLKSVYPKIKTSQSLLSHGFRRGLFSFAPSGADHRRRTSFDIPWVAFRL